MSLGGEQEPLLKLSSGKGYGPRKLKHFVARMWSGGAREHYASESNSRKLL